MSMEEWPVQSFNGGFTMNRIRTMLGVALIAALPSLAHAQVIIVQPGRTYVPAPVYVNPPVVSSSYYVAPSVSPPLVTYSSPTYSYYSGPSTITYSAPPVFTYSAPTAVYLPAPRLETRTYYGYGIFRPRGWYTETYYRP
jgi:hypothetical protein